MEFQKEFSHSAFGGFKKEEVIAYLEQISKQVEKEQTELKNELARKKTESSEMNSVIEEQYRKIVDISKETQELKNSLERKEIEIADLKRELLPFQEAVRNASDILDVAKEESRRVCTEAQSHLTEIRSEADGLLDHASEKAKLVIAQAEDQANRLLAAAEDQAKTLVESAKRKEGATLSAAKKEAVRITKESEDKEREANHILEEARKKSEEMIARAKIQSKEERSRYEDGLKNLEQQRAHLLLAIEEAKSKVQAFMIQKPIRLEADTVRREAESAETIDSFSEDISSNAEAIRKKFTFMNNKAEIK